MINRQGQQGHIRVKSPTVTAKVCAIVLAVSGTPEQSISEVARHTGLPVSTTHRLLYELVQGGLLERNPAGRFRVCVELQLLLGPRERAAQARSLVGTVLEDLAVATGLRARFEVWHPTGISYLEQAPDIPPGSCVSGPRLLPAHATASGKAMLARMRHSNARAQPRWHTVGALELITDVLADRARLSSPALAVAATQPQSSACRRPFPPTDRFWSRPSPVAGRPIDGALSWCRPEEVG